ncbi:MAG: o-succinylbenzoate synthase [Gammaproteobacteria bacterium]|nr:o-succinylbenzoate synthase [Gammaproteobacteria bacterium]
MNLRDVELRRIGLSLVHPFRTSFGTEQKRDILLVHVEADDSEGWGECAAMQEPVYSSEYVDGAQQVIREHFLPRLTTDVSAASLSKLLAPFHGHPMAKAALEMAVLDAELRASGASLATHLGATRSRVPVGVSVGIFDEIPELLDTVENYLSRGYTRVKLKIEPGWDIDPVRAVRERFGDDLLLQVDANTAYNTADIGHLAGLDRFGLLLIEQPFAKEDLLTHAAFARRIATPVCLDESITSVRTAAAAIELGACSIVNIKAGRVGGYLEARRIHDLCAERNVPVWCGGMLETGLGRAANLALAGLPNFLYPGDISETARYYEHDITPPFVLEPDGTIAVPDGPGLGVQPDPDRLEEVTTSVEHIRLL